MRYRKNPRIIDKDMKESLLLFDTESGRMVELNSTARLLWKGSKPSFDQSDLERIVHEGCNKPRNVERDIREFIAAAVKHNLVSVDED